MTEPTLLQQARQLMESASHEDHLFDQALPVFRAVDRMLRYLEERHAAASGPAQVPGEAKCKVCGHVADSAPHRWGSDDYVQHEFVPESQADADDRLRLQRELATMHGQFKSFDLDLERTRQGAVDPTPDEQRWLARIKELEWRAELARLVLAGDTRALSEALAHGPDGAVPAPVVVKPTPTDADNAFAGYLDELERLCNQATPGPWEMCPKRVYFVAADGSPVCDITDFDNYGPIELRGHGAEVSGNRPAGSMDANADFICAARHALPKLIERVRELRSCIDGVESDIAEFGDNPATALGIVSERLGLADHYRRYPNAAREQ
jgi:hypothetical protein